MTRLPVISGATAVKALVKLGWEVKRQHGSHVILTKPGYVESLSVPQHKELSKGTLRGLISKAGITVDDFVEAVKG